MNKKTIKEMLFRFTILLLGIASITGCSSSKNIQSIGDIPISIPTMVSTTDTIYIVVEEIGFRSSVPLFVDDTLNINMGNEGKDYKIILKEKKIRFYSNTKEKVKNRQLYKKMILNFL